MAWAFALANQSDCLLYAAFARSMAQCRHEVIAQKLANIPGPSLDCNSLVEYQARTLELSHRWASTFRIQA